MSVCRSGRRSVGSLVADWPLVFPPPSAARPPAWRLLAGPSVGPAGRPSDTGGIAVCPSVRLAGCLADRLSWRSFVRPSAACPGSAVGRVRRPVLCGRPPARPPVWRSVRPPVRASVCLPFRRSACPSVLSARRAARRRSARPLVVWLPSVLPTGRRSVRPSARPRPRLPGRRLACVRSWVVGLSVG